MATSTFYAAGAVRVCMHRGVRSTVRTVRAPSRLSRVRCAYRSPRWSWCAAFALGSSSSTACPASYARLDTADACKSAADAASRTYGGSVANTYYPTGCYWHTVAGSAYYNTNAAGAGNVFAQPLCAGAARRLHTRQCDRASPALTHRAGAAATAPTFSPAGGMHALSTALAPL